MSDGVFFHIGRFEITKDSITAEKKIVSLDKVVSIEARTQTIPGIIAGALGVFTGVSTLFSQGSGFAILIELLLTAFILFIAYSAFTGKIMWARTVSGKVRLGYLSDQHVDDFLSAFNEAKHTA